MVINRLGYDKASTIGLISKHGFMKLRFCGRALLSGLSGRWEIGYEMAVDRDRSKPRADAVTRPRWWPGAERSKTINGNRNHQVRTEEEKLPCFGSDSTVEPWQRNP